MGEPLTAAALSDQDLRSGFASFVEAARRLEESYTALKARAAEIDLQLSKANERLATTLAEREAVFSALPVGVIALDEQGEERFRNAAGERLGERASELGFDMMAAPEGLHELEDLSLRLSRVPMADGGSLVLIEDRSQVARLEREVDRLDRLAGLSELALGVAHEIKNPLNGVMGFASLIERQSDPEQIKRYAEKIGAGMRDVDTIVKAMLAFARPSEREIAPRPIGDCVAAAAAEAGMPRDRIEVRGPSELCVDGPTIVRVLANLFRNSCEAGSGAIAIDVTEQPNELCLDVVDDGPGVGSDVRDRVFEPFVSSKDRGHGLGLALVARVLSFLGGSIELQNPGEKGAHFRVRVPYADGGAHG
ncbi:MAG: hypothetical protein KDB80_01920 [Planctomycetes bacterium]|nr:hypothetical protein [Planctomycetota bacterium]